MTMSDATVGNQSPLCADSFDALRPHRSTWFFVIAVLVTVLVAATVWVSPSYSNMRLQNPSNMSGSGLWAHGLDATLVSVVIEIHAVGGVTVKGIDPVGTATLVGVWVLDQSAQDRLSDAARVWMRTCVNGDGMTLTGTADMCQVPRGQTAGQALLTKLIALGAPLDASTQVPRHLANNTQGSLVALWFAPTCDSASSSFARVRTSRFGLPGSGVINIYQWPGCWGG